MMRCRIRTFFSWLLLLGAIVWAGVLVLGLLNPRAAADMQSLAATRLLLNQSHQTLSALLTEV
jgi:hypothetical protein